jgi:hypothetical protein
LGLILLKRSWYSLFVISEEELELSRQLDLVRVNALTEPLTPLALVTTENAASGSPVISSLFTKV